MRWTEFARCQEKFGEAPDDWDLTSASEPQRMHAVAVCAACPVMAQCLEDAIVKPPFGMIQAGLGWKWPSREPLDAVTLKRSKPPKPRSPSEAPGSAVHGTYTAYARGCKAGEDGGSCGPCRAAKRAYNASRRASAGAVGQMA